MATSWSDTEAKLVQVLLQQGKNSEDIRQELSKLEVPRTQKAIQRFIARQQAKGLPGWHAMVAESPIEVAEQPMCVPGDFMLWADVHAPLHDAGLANASIDTALQQRIPYIVLAGDLVNLDSLSFWGNEGEAVAEQDITVTEQILTTLAHEFVQVYWFAGNHELRIARKLDKLVRMQRLFNLFVRADNVTVSDFTWCWADSGGRRYRLTHPRSRARHATLVARDLCAIHNTSVVCGHGHLWGITKDVSGRHFAVDSGVVVDPSKILYTLKRDTRDPKMMQGVVIVKEGLPELLCPETLRIAPSR